MMPLLGSDERMRGYYRGRYRDKRSSAASWNTAGSSPGGTGLSPRAGAGTMGPSLSSLNNGRWLPSAGVGYRFEFKPRVNVRLDYGIGNGSSGFYFRGRRSVLTPPPLNFLSYRLLSGPLRFNFHELFFL